VRSAKQRTGVCSRRRFPASAVFKRRYAGKCCTSLIPQPIVQLNRLTILAGVVVACVLQAPLITTVRFTIVTPAATFGRSASLVYWIGTILFRPSTARPDGEDSRLMRFNNALAALVLGAAQIGFVLRAPVLGWIFAGLAALAATVALAGCCFGCLVFSQFKLNRARFFRSRPR
jgi:hypothetical protein